LRSDDEPNFSISRYFVTVRRAMLTVCPDSMSAIFWSDSGFFESSFSMISLMRFLTLSDATNSP
jgi:hypothetical protein